MRSGSLDVPAIRGFAVAMRHATTNLASGAQRLTALRDRLIVGAQDAGFGVQVSGDWEPGDGTARLPGLGRGYSQRAAGGWQNHTYEC